MTSSEKLCLDKYLWSIRLFKTRCVASTACECVKVKYDGNAEAKRWRIKVTGLLHNRMAYAEAIKYYIDITPEEELQRIQYQAATFHTGKRRSKIGRPTKKERRELDDFLED